MFSGNSFGIDFGKSEEEKYKGTNIGVHLCNKINLDTLSNSALKSDGKIKEINFIKSRCAKKHEKKTGVNTYGRWVKFAEQVKSHSEELKRMIPPNNDRMLAYGASARGSTLLNFCGINSNQISAIIDKNPLKKGLLTPGSNIPIISFEEGLNKIKDVGRILLLAWNFEEEIVNDLRAAGFTGQFIVPLPNKPHIV